MKEVIPFEYKEAGEKQQYAILFCRKHYQKKNTLLILILGLLKIFTFFQKIRKDSVCVCVCA